MELSEFKSHIVNNSLPNTMVIAKCTGNGDFIFHQYINEFATKNNLSIEYIDDLTLVPTSNLFGVPSSTLYMYTTDNVHKSDNIPTCANLWVKTKKIDKQVSLDYAEYIVEMPKLESWQIKDYIMSITNLSESLVDDIITVYKDNIYRLDMELNKIILCGNDKDSYELVKDQLYTDTTHYVIYDLINSIIKKDINNLSSILSNIDKIDVEPFGLLTLLLNNFKHVINIQLNPKATASNLNMSANQFWAIKKYSCGFYTKEQLIKLYRFLTECDYKIKSGQLDTAIMVDYIINKILTF